MTWLSVAVRAVRRDASRAALQPAPAGGVKAPVLVSRAGKTARLIDLDSVDWVEAAGRYSAAHVNGSRFLLDESLTSLNGRLAGHRFVRVHRSALVRLDRITGMTSLNGRDFELLLTSGTTVRMSRTYRAGVEEALGISL
jgi:two-component system LytT family response regulator